MENVHWNDFTTTEAPVKLSPKLEFRSRVRILTDRTIDNRNDLLHLISFTETLDGYIKSLDDESLCEEELTSINEKLNHMLFLQDMLLKDVKSLLPLSNNLTNEAFFVQNGIQWKKTIKSS